jgi:membrane-associated phospholipid phosphatase
MGRTASAPVEFADSDKVCLQCRFVRSAARPVTVPEIAGDHFWVGAHYVSEGIYRGSFPSGHTAAIFILMALITII